MSVKNIHAFLSQLAENNNRDWMTENKSWYLAAKKDFVTVIDGILRKFESIDPSYEGVVPKDCIYRINRDIRFSKNKDPYKLNFGATISPTGRKSELPGYYIQLKPGENFIGGGLYMPQSEWLKKVRQEIDYSGDEYLSILQESKFKQWYSAPYGDTLITAPKGYPKDHPMIIFLRQKSFVYLHSFSDKQAQSDQLIEHAFEGFQILTPFLDFLNRALD